MRLILITGGARSGKSTYAQRRAQELGGDHAVTVVATARASDEEMQRRIAAHRAARPERWETIEAQRDAASALRAAINSVVVLDCITLLASNALLDSASDGESAAQAAVLAEIDGIVGVRAEREGTLLVVSNEVGFGIVPDTQLGRWFRDALGLANQRLAAAADTVVCMISGVPMELKAEESA